MEDNTFINTNIPITYRDIQEVENKYHISLPEAYRNHLLKYNGGTPKREYFKTEEGAYWIDCFLPLKSDNPQIFTFEDAFNDSKINPVILPEGLLPIAIDPGGNYYCISMGEGDYESIYFYKMDDYDEKDFDAALTFLSSSLDDFINNMVDESEIES